MRFYAYGAFMMLAGYLLGRGTIYRWFLLLKRRWHYRQTMKRVIAAELEELRSYVENTVWPADAVMLFAAFLVAHEDANISSNEEWMAARVEEFCARENWTPKPQVIAERQVVQAPDIEGWPEPRKEWQSGD